MFFFFLTSLYATTVFFKKFKKIFAPQNIKKTASKVAHNPTRPRVFSPANIWHCGDSFKV